MSAVRKFRADAAGEDVSRGESSGTFDGLERVLRFSLQATEATPDAARDRSGMLTGRDIAQALDLVHEAAQNIRAAEERARDGEARTQALLQRATEELRQAEARVQAAEGRTRAAEARAQESETRAKEAENWLRQIFATIAEELPARR